MLVLIVTVAINILCSEESKVITHSDDAFAPVAYLKLNKLSLHEKTEANQSPHRPSSWQPN